MAFIRMYGMEGDPGPRPAPKRKSAAAGPRAKAARKRVVRSRRAARGGNVGGKKGPGVPFSQSHAGVTDFFGKLAGGLPLVGGAAESLITGAANLGGGKLKINAHGQLVRHRRMNVLNPKALTKSMRRVSGFVKRAHTAEKQLAKIARRVIHPQRRLAIGKRRRAS